MSDIYGVTRLVNQRRLQRERLELDKLDVLERQQTPVMGKPQIKSQVTGTWKYERGVSRLMHDDLHWLVIPQRVQYKLAVTVHRFLRHRAPRYLADYCVPVSEVAGRQHLRSARSVSYTHLTLPTNREV